VDPAAALTLHVAAFLQTEADAPRSAARWALVPGPGRGADTFAGAAARLAALPKPLVVGALNQPGYVAVWPAAALAEPERLHVEHTLQNQLAGAADSLARLGCGDAALVRFEGWGAAADVPASVLRQWLGEYALTWGWRLGPATGPDHGARLLVFHSGRRWSPGDVALRPCRAAAERTRFRRGSGGGP
jgi:hypothetical protein